MLLKELDIVSFKNIASTKLNFSPAFNCFVGKNGAGKTNVLDAIFHLSMCKSCFALTDNQLIKYDAPFYVLQGNYVRDGETLDIYCGFKRGAKKTFKKNKKSYTKLSEHIGLLPLVMISPNDVALVDGSSEERRKLLDSIISQFNKEYLGQLIKYNKILTQRNSMLKAFVNKAIDVDMLDVIDEQLSECGDYIYKERVRFIDDFVVLFQKYYDMLSLASEKVTLTYKPSVGSGGMKDELKLNYDRDRILTYTSVGIHRDDLILKLDGHLVKKIGSQGQKKSFLVALKLAQYDCLYKMSGVKPLLLLDDVFDKLDADRVGQIMKIVSGENFGQIFITDTNRHNIVDMLQELVSEFSLFIVDKGEVNICELSNIKK